MNGGKVKTSKKKYVCVRLPRFSKRLTVSIAIVVISILCPAFGSETDDPYLSRVFVSFVTKYCFSIFNRSNMEYFLPREPEDLYTSIEQTDWVELVIYCKAVYTETINYYLLMDLLKQWCRFHIPTEIQNIRNYGDTSSKRLIKEYTRATNQASRPLYLKYFKGLKLIQILFCFISINANSIQLYEYCLQIEDCILDVAKAVEVLSALANENLIISEASNITKLVINETLYKNFSFIDLLIPGGVTFLIETLPKLLTKQNHEMAVLLTINQDLGFTYSYSGRKCAISSYKVNFVDQLSETGLNSKALISSSIFEYYADRFSGRSVRCVIDPRQVEQKRRNITKPFKLRKDLIIGRRFDSVLIGLPQETNIRQLFANKLELAISYLVSVKPFFMELKSDARYPLLYVDLTIPLTKKDKTTHVKKRILSVAVRQPNSVLMLGQLWKGGLLNDLSYTHFKQDMSKLGLEDFERVIGFERIYKIGIKKGDNAWIEAIDGILNCEHGGCDQSIIGITDGVGAMFGFLPLLDDDEANKLNFDHIYLARHDKQDMISNLAFMLANAARSVEKEVEYAITRNPRLAALTKVYEKS